MHLSALIVTVLITCLVQVFFSLPADAAKFSLLDGEITGSLDTTLTYAVSARTSKPTSKNDLQNITQSDWTFDKGEVVSNLGKIAPELEVKWRNYGLFGRAVAFYDTRIALGSSGRGNYPLDQGTGNGWTDEAKDYAGHRVELLDMFAYANYELKNMPGLGTVPVDIRLGQQAFNWGEGTFYKDGINTTNPLDINRFVLPGAEIKEATIPLLAAYVHMGLHKNLSLEGYYQFKWRKTVLPPVGTFYGDDFIGPGGRSVIAQIPSSQGGDALAQAIALAQLLDTIPTNIVGMDPGRNIFRLATRHGDEYAKDSSQFGISARYLLENWEVGLYFVNYHSHLPMFRFKEPGPADHFAICTQLGANCTNINVAASAIAQSLANNSFELFYPENIRMYGLSLATTLGNFAVAGEVAYRPNQPVVTLNPVAFLGKQVANIGNIAGGIPYDGGLAGTILPGTTVELMEKRETWNVSMNALRIFGAGLSFDKHTLLLAAAMDCLPGTIPQEMASTGPVGTRPSVVAWGYSMRLDSTWFNVLPAWNLTPGVTFQHDVSGYSHFWGNFREGRLRSQFRLTADYLNCLTANLNYSLVDSVKPHGSHLDTVNFSLSYKF